MPNLPQDLVDFLQSGEGLRYDPTGTEIGYVALKSFASLGTSTIAMYPGCQNIIDDPYYLLDGRYQIEVVNLIAESESYDADGLLCWITRIQEFGSVDPDHGTIVAFPGVTWSTIVADPVRFLDQQWDRNEEISDLVQPWMHFPFRLSKSSLTLNPYGSHCSKHGCPLLTGGTRRNELFDIFRRRAVDDWLANYIAHFPCAGVPVDENDLLHCPECSSAEEKWFRRLEESIPVLTATPRKSDGWIQCPGCGIRFSTLAPESFSHNVHLRCGQRIRLVEAGEESCN
jgi:hypothetical protein